jgi:hypothetical protein
MTGARESYSLCTRWIAFVALLICLGSVCVLIWSISVYRGTESQKITCGTNKYGYTKCYSLEDIMVATYAFYIIGMLFLSAIMCIIWGNCCDTSTSIYFVMIYFIFCFIWSWCIWWIYFSKGIIYSVTNLEWIPFIIWSLVNLIIITGLLYLSYIGLKSFDFTGLFMTRSNDNKQTVSTIDESKNIPIKYPEFDHV